MIENVYITHRSVLYNLEPIGIGSELVESLTSYLTRIAFEHDTTVGHLVNKLLIPTINKEYLLRSSDLGGNRFYEGAKTINGYMENSMTVVKAMQTLTNRNDIEELTLIKWRDIVPLRELLKKDLAWCPKCIKEWKESSKKVYYPIIWFLDIVKVCPIHSCYLIDVCPSFLRNKIF
ncbi:hypothetical protein EKG37_17700 [Robertmurraya yapensis]|uniref:TniQ domain-containing protein n=1 Tax=Bacillus yapensis TaxID=2492960 RepID=A0A3S0JSN1_9BACI|nr:TniQ family protein [Bacillus yapensis]RTR28136.1 hypothetical protein EKG37_17700 [Bacillus yapensis]TKS94379.1 hypothetical protein FAR12_17705 [Bacillus yapensis]